MFCGTWHANESGKLFKIFIHSKLEDICAIEKRT